MLPDIRQRKGTAANHDGGGRRQSPVSRLHRRLRGWADVYGREVDGRAVERAGGRRARVMWEGRARSASGRHRLVVAEKNKLEKAVH